MGRGDPSPNLIRGARKSLVTETAKRKHHVMWGTLVFSQVPPRHLMIFSTRKFGERISLPSITSCDGFSFPKGDGRSKSCSHTSELRIGCLAHHSPTVSVSRAQQTREREGR